MLQIYIYHTAPLLLLLLRRHEDLQPPQLDVALPVLSKVHPRRPRVPQVLPSALRPERDLAMDHHSVGRARAPEVTRRRGEDGDGCVESLGDADPGLGAESLDGSVRGERAEGDDAGCALSEELGRVDLVRIGVVCQGLGRGDRQSMSERCGRRRMREQPGRELARSRFCYVMTLQKQETNPEEQYRTWRLMHKQGKSVSRRFITFNKSERWAMTYRTR